MKFRISKTIVKVGVNQSVTVNFFNGNYFVSVCYGYVANLHQRDDSMM